MECTKQAFIHFLPRARAFHKTNCIGQNEGRPINKFHFWKFPKSPRAPLRIIICRSTDPFVTFGFRKRAFDDESERGCCCDAFSLPRAAPTGQWARVSIHPFFYRPRINKTAAFNITPARAPLCISEKEIDINLQIAFSSFAPPPQKRAWHFSLSFSVRAAGLLNFKISLFHSNTHIHSVSTRERESFLLCIQPCAGAVRDLIKSFAPQRA